MFVRPKLLMFRHLVRLCFKIQHKLWCLLEVMSEKNSTRHVHFTCACAISLNGFSSLIYLYVHAWG